MLETEVLSYHSSSLGIINYVTVSILCSLFALRSCEGFEDGTFHMWCCTKRQCNIQYTQQAVEDLGYPLQTDLELLTCHELYPQHQKESELARKGSSTLEQITIPLIASAVALVTLLAVAFCVLWRHKRQQRLARLKEEEMQIQIGNYEQQLEHHRERSKNEQAELQKVKMQYKMLEMDLLANTAGSGDKALNSMVRL
jgi:hypothetical protein